jgi:hypothetical protein
VSPACTAQSNLDRVLTSTSNLGFEPLISISTNTQHRLGRPSRDHLHPPARPLFPSVPDETGGQDGQSPGGQVLVEYQFLVVRHRGECSRLAKWIEWDTVEMM